MPGIGPAKRRIIASAEFLGLVREISGNSYWTQYRRYHSLVCCETLKHQPQRFTYLKT